jgi:hypothetical protein
MKFEKATPVSLKAHSEFDEKWLQERLVDDPGLLGLGDLGLKDVERRQPRVPVIEKSRYPPYEHVAVLVAENVTSRFLNVITSFNKAIPLVAIQMQALEVGGILTLQAATVLDLMPLGTDEEDEAGQTTDRSYWIGRGSEKSVAVADENHERRHQEAPRPARRSHPPGKRHYAPW